MLSAHSVGVSVGNATDALDDQSFAVVLVKTPGLRQTRF